MLYCMADAQSGNTQPEVESESEGMKAALRRAGLTQAQFAREIDASVGCVNGWCAGRTGRTGRKALAYRLAMKLLERMGKERLQSAVEDIVAAVGPDGPR